MGNDKAVKVIVDSRESYEAEVLNSSLILHENSINWIDHGVVQGDPAYYWIVYPLMDCDLREYVYEIPGHQRERVAKMVLKQLLPVVRILQENHLVHSDISSSNILVKKSARFPKFYLHDFGASHSYTELMNGALDPARKDVMCLMAVAASVMSGSYVDVSVLEEKSQKDWFNNILGFLTKLPKGAQIPFHRIENLLRNHPEQPDTKFDADRLVHVMDQLQQSRQVIQRVLDKKGLKMASLQKMKESVKDNCFPLIEHSDKYQIWVYTHEGKPRLTVNGKYLQYDVPISKMLDSPLLFETIL